jgi:anthranilate synthase component 1
MRTELARPALVPVWREVPADLETPVSAYLKLARGPYSYLLESVEGGERLARYSFVGVDPYLVLTLRGEQAELRWLAGPRTGTRERVHCHDPLELVQAELERRPLDPAPGVPRFHGGAVGYLSYEAAARFEPRVPVPARDALGLPESIFLFSDTLLIFDHVRHSARLVTHADLEAARGDPARAQGEAHRRLDQLEQRLRRGRAPRRPATPRRVAGADATGAARLPGAPDHVRGSAPRAGSSQLEPQPAYEDAVRRAQEYIRAGDCFQIVPSRRVARPTAAPPFEIYRALRSINPSPYMFYLALGDFAVAGASPELLVRVEDGEVAIHPIAGTRRRSPDVVEDAALEADLRADDKERAEHVMLVDLGRNDVGRVSEPGSVRVTQFMGVERYSHVMHLVSHVSGRLRAGLTPYDALRAGFPAGTVSGAPKIRAMEIIAELEGERRGVYSGAVGYFGYDGNLDTCIALRTLVLKDGVAYAQAGGGVVYDSEPAREYEETQNKLRAVLQALEEAEKRCSC